MKSDQEQSQGLKKQTKRWFNFGFGGSSKVNLSDRQNQQRQTKGQSLDQTNHNQSRQSRSTRQEISSSSSKFNQNLSMQTIKPSSSSINQNQKQKAQAIEPKKGLLNFSSRRETKQSNSKTKRKTITSDHFNPSNPLNSEIISRRSSRRQKSKRMGSLSSKSTPHNSAQNAIVRRLKPKPSIQLAPQLSSQGKNQPKLRKKQPSLFLSLIRLLILGIGIGAIVGTILSIFDSNQNLLTQKMSSRKEINQELNGANLQLPPQTQEITLLKQELQGVTSQYPDLNAGIFMLDLDTQGYIDVQAQNIFSAASTIKIFILMAFFEDVDGGKIRLDEQLVMDQDVIGGGSGDMQYQQVGTMFSALETATKMIVISDNTATNMLIKRLGGKELLNQRFQQWGLANTKINNLLPDLEGTNTTTPKDLAVILGFVNQGDILSLRSRDRVLEIMRQTKTRTLLPQGLGEGASIAHKTGDIGTVLGDAGVIDMPNGKRYLASVLVTRPHNDIRGRTLIQEISRTIYNYLETHPDQPLPASTPTPTTDN